MEEHKSHHLLLQLILTQRRGMSVDKIKALSKQEVHAPMNFHDMAQQLKMSTIANNNFLGEYSVGSQCNCNRSMFKAWECLDKEFTYKFLLAVNPRYQIWLKQCRMAQNRSDIDYSIINFSQLVSQVSFSSFHITLPPTFKMKEPKATIAATSNGKKDSSHIGGGNDGKHKKKKPDKARDLIKNKAPHPDLNMLLNEAWATTFSNKNINKRPKWNDKSHACPRWLLQKYCFSNYKHEDSHVKANKILANNLASMKAWIKLCQSNDN
jgi:hypothetical protein